MFRVLILLLVASPAFADQRPSLDETPFAPFLTAQTFTCTGKTCGQMESCAEACHALTVCGDQTRDRDNDRIPCESLCSAPC